MTAAEQRLTFPNAPAKINLTLHLRGQRSDGYHLLDSLVVFTGVGDRITRGASGARALSIEGPFASDLDTESDNLVLRAAKALATHAGRADPGALILEKNLPVSSGIGGGSSDAAAALRLLAAEWGVDVPPDLSLALGADVPVCCAAPRPQIMRGIGEDLSPAPELPAAWLVLVNPRVGVSTGQIFNHTTEKSPLAAPDLPQRGFSSFNDLIGWLRTQRNDLQPAAAKLCPPIADVLQALGTAPLARMSGSGATCFALVPDQAAADDMADRLKTSGWWVTAAPVLTSKSVLAP